MRTTYSHFAVITCLVAATTQTYASTETQEALEITRDFVSEDLEKIQNNGVHIVEGDHDTPEMRKKRVEKEALELENALTRARLEKELADLRAEFSRLIAEREVMDLKWQIEQDKKKKAHKTEIHTLNQQKEKLEAEVSIAQYQLAKEEEQRRAITTKWDYQIKLLQAEVEQMHAQKARYEAACQRNHYADIAPIYLKDPLQADGSLVISDRHIDLDGVITPWKANYVTDRIQYFNNKDASNPIFIVIESSPGGSVSAGSCILKAMENSQAPVYVVVKSFAASMAALITTLADRSYAYPNAVILHHQPWTFAWGNVRELKESQEWLQEWWNRLGGRVAKKMGISLKKLDKLLYEKSARGDWLEFADHAQRLKWVDHNINGIQDSGMRELPSSGCYTYKSYYERYYGDDNYAGATAVESGVIYLPPLHAGDFYYLHNPDNRYQMRSPSQ